MTKRPLLLALLLFSAPARAGEAVDEARALFKEGNLLLEERDYAAALERYRAAYALHPSVKILALAFLLLIGVMLVAEGMGQHVPKGYIYFAMAFSLFVELLNMRYRKSRRPVALHHRFGDR